MSETGHALRSACPVCSGGSMVREVRVTRFEYFGETLTYEQAGDWCTECGEAVLSGEDMESTEQLIVNFMRRVDQARVDQSV